MSLDDIATINVSTTGAGVTRAGYGVPLIVSHGSQLGADRVRAYTSLSAVAADFLANSPEYMAAEQIFGQSPKLRRIMIGRAALRPTQRFSIGVQSVNTAQPYRVRVAVPTGVVFTSQDATYNSGAGATGWRPSGLWSKGDLVIASDGVGLWSCVGPSQAAYENGFTGYGGASGPTGVSGDFRENQIYWSYVGSGVTGAVTNDAIMIGLKSKIEALGAPTAIATGVSNCLQTSLQGSAGSRTLRLLANTAANFFGLQVYSRAALNCSQDHSDPGIATDLAAIKLASNSWYGLVTPFNSEALINAAAGWVESNSKLYPAATLDSAVATVTESGSATDVGHDIKAASYARSWAFHHPSNDEFADAAQLGKFFTFSPGSETWRMKTLTGVTAETYTDTEITNMKARYAHYYYDLGGLSVVGGDAKTGAGEYVDRTRGIDWYTSELQADLADMLLGSAKVPFTNPGIDMVEAVVRKRNTAGIKAGLIAADPEPVVTAPDVADVSTANKTARTLTDVVTEWTLAGAIHHITVTVTAST